MRPNDQYPYHIHITAPSATVSVNELPLPRKSVLHNWYVWICTIPPRWLLMDNACASTRRLLAFTTMHSLPVTQGVQQMECEAAEL